jgi:hypothetical protein
MKEPLVNRLQKASVNSGFRQEGYFVWCGSVIKADGEYHLFASRWPKVSTFPEGYRDHSEIVRATASRAEGPYTFQEVVLTGRSGSYWDGKMCHNPKIVRIGETYVLYYIGSACGSGLRKIGYAHSLSPAGPWTRMDEPIPLGEDANNPAPLVLDDGAVLMAYRDLDLHMHIARASWFDGEYRILAEDIFPAGPLEDPDLFFENGEYHMVIEDNEGVLTGHVRFGGHLVSTDGVTWRPCSPKIAYTHHIEFEDGSELDAERRERPQLFCDSPGDAGNAGGPTHLVTAVLAHGDSWCLIQPIRPDIGSDMANPSGAQQNA